MGEKTPSVSVFPVNNSTLPSLIHTRKLFGNRWMHQTDRIFTLLQTRYSFDPYCFQFVDNSHPAMGASRRTAAKTWLFPNIGLLSFHLERNRRQRRRSNHGRKSVVPWPGAQTTYTNQQVGRRNCPGSGAGLKGHLCGSRYGPCANMGDGPDSLALF
jgi:hypothetical protein